MSAPLPELDELHRILDAGRGRLEVREACSAQSRGARWPVYEIALGCAPADAPAVGFFGGVHGLERVGTHVVLEMLGSLVARLHWDEVLHEQLRSLRLVFMPLVNPAGMAARTRCNGNGVDLMRNAPVQSAEKVVPLAGGHRLTPRLPWYRGPRDAPMESEAAALCATVERELLPRPFSIALDCHSGFGMRDRIWFPHAHTKTPFAGLAEVLALRDRFEAQHPGHAYLFEPQSRHYLAHGDLWDFLHARAPADPPGRFIPLTLEMGSWRWIRKRPRQALTRMGLFNPLPADRLDRVRRNHLLWMNFLCGLAHDWRRWAPSAGERAAHERRALDEWFRKRA